MPAAVLSRKTVEADVFNPYVVGPPVESEGFYGRQDILNWVEKSLLDLRINSLVLHGQRRTGKTSILLQLRRRMSQERFCPVYFDLMDYAARGLSKLLYDLSVEICDAAGHDSPRPDKELDRSEWFLDTLIPMLLDRLGNARRLVLLLDEFDVLDYTVTQGLPEGAAAHTFLPFVRRLMSTEPRIGIVFVVGRHESDISRDQLATFKSSHSRFVWVLSEPEARDLVLSAKRQGTLDLADDAVSRIYFLARGHPYFTQLLCFYVWERMHALQAEHCPPVSSQDVDAAVPESLMSGGSAIEWIWDGLSPEEQVYASAIAASTREGADFDKQRVERFLESRAARLRSRPVAMAPDTLVKRGMLVVTDGRKYQFAIELFRRWIRENRPIDSVKDRLDEVDPAAHALFEKGRRAYLDGQLEGAAECCDRALELNSEHFGARLYLGKTLLRLGQIPAAIETLERAYRADRYAAEEYLIRAWKTRVDKLGPLGEIEDSRLAEAAVVFRRLEELQPEEPTWQDARSRVETEADLLARFWVGVGAFEQKLWAEAQRAFADVVFVRPTYERDEVKAAEYLQMAVDKQPEGDPDAEQRIGSRARELAYTLNARQYGQGHDHSIAQATIARDGSAMFRREIRLQAFSVLTELNYYTKLPEAPEGGDVDYAAARAIGDRHRFEPEVIQDSEDTVEVRNRIVPPLLPGEQLRYEGEDRVFGLYALPPVKTSTRKLPFDYYARDIHCPTRQLEIEVLFPPGIEPVDPWSEVWYAVGMSMVPQPGEGQRAKKLLSKRRIGDQYMLSLTVDYPVLGLTYVVAWSPDRLIDHYAQSTGDSSPA